MNPSDVLRLLSLAAIWGGSFLFMRMGAATLSPAVMIEARVGLGALFLLLVSRWLKHNRPLLKHWKHFLILGLLNSALPFLLFAWSAQMLTASMLSVLNATASIWGVLVGVILNKSHFTARTSIGLICGICGVLMLVGLDPVSLQQGAPLAITAGLGAALCYSLGGVYASSYSSGNSCSENTGSSNAASNTEVTPFDNAHGSLWAATLLIVPLLPFAPSSGLPDANIIMAVVSLGVLCTGVAYLLYFRLIANLGGPSALTVTYLIPVFGILWGHIFLDEAVGWHTVAGALMVIIGTALVTGFSVSNLVSKRSTEHD
ncbi:DMT family transporter [Spongorhabdus nitratireducens]